jgi:predicted nuclease of predicted toxin-antitoxin system
MKFLLDEGVIVSAGNVLETAGHEVIFFNESGIVNGSADPTVCATALLNGAILVAQDGDMKTLARGHGITPAQFNTLSLLRLRCRESDAPRRIKEALTLIQHEWDVAVAGGGRLLITIGDRVVTTHR